MSQFLEREPVVIQIHMGPPEKLFGMPIPTGRIDVHLPPELATILVPDGHPAPFRTYDTLYPPDSTAFQQLESVIFGQGYSPRFESLNLDWKFNEVF
jgi:hypothetical protein